VSLAIVGIRKFWTRSATLVSILLVIGFVVLEFVAVGAGYRSGGTASTGLDKDTVTWFLSFPTAFDAILVIVYEFVAIVGLIYIATASGSEWSWGTLKVAVARGESRWHYTVSTFASLSIILLAGMLIAFLVGIAAVVVGASIAGLPVGNPADPAQFAQVAVKLARCWIALMALTSVGYAVAMIAKNQMAGIGTVIVYFVVSILSQALLPDIIKQVLKYQPFNITADAIGLAGPPTGGVASSAAAVEPNLALLISIGWLVALVGITALSVERTEITG
jgi:ABC-type transport system involved in multi-copper enzyme maturation permease subunit